MRFALMRNNTPAGAVSMRLRIDAGAIQESDAQQGIAHLLEHMAFRGSKKIADGDVVRTLERLGLRFGADTNASTGFTQTIYSSTCRVRMAVASTRRSRCCARSRAN